MEQLKRLELLKVSMETNNSRDQSLNYLKTLRHVIFLHYILFNYTTADDKPQWMTRVLPLATRPEK